VEKPGQWLVSWLRLDFFILPLSRLALLWRLEMNVALPDKSVDRVALGLLQVVVLFWLLRLLIFFILLRFWVSADPLIQLLSRI
jgi:hypothetical protein